jgi:hypothetical protein
VLAALLLSAAALPASPLYFHTHAVADIVALVAADTLVPLADLHTESMVADHPPAAAAYSENVQIITLKILRVVRFEAQDPGVSPLLPGDSIQITNPFLDQSPPFRPGDSIETRIRLVLPAEAYDPRHPRKQWWFFPTDDRDPISAPRRPFIGVRKLN